MDPSEREWALSGGARPESPPIGSSFVRFPLPTQIEPAPVFPWGDVENPLPSSLSILLPALNEEHGVEAVLKRIPRSTLKSQGLAYSVYLLDGRSTDQTRAVASHFGAHVFVQTGIGKGSAFREFVPHIKEDMTVLLDSDGTYPPESIPQLVGALGRESPVVLGSRLRGSINEGAMSSANYLGNRALSWFASFLFDTPISDVCSGMWAFRSDRLKSLGLTANGFELEADIFAECALRGIPIAEIPIRYDKRIGKPKLRFREGVKIAMALLKKRLQSSPRPAEKPAVEAGSRSHGPAEGSG